MPYSIEKREAKKAKSGYTYRYKATYMDNYGIKQTESKSGFKTKKEAIQAAEDLLHEVKKGIMPNSSKKTLDDVWKDYLELEAKNLRPGTLYDYKNVYKNHIKPKLGNCQIRSLDYKKMQKFFNEAPPKRASFIRTVINRIFSTAVKLGYIPYSPIHEVTLPRISENEVVIKENYITPKRLYELLKLVKKEEFKRMIWIGYYLGLRLGEALGLDWENIDLEKGKAHIVQQVIRKDKVTKDLKTKASKATLPIPVPLLNMMKEWKKDGCPYVIHDKKGRRRKYADVIYKFYTTEDFHFHALRHTYITNLAQTTRSIKTVMKLARHSKIEMTLQYYTEVTDEMMEEAIEETFPILPQNEED